MAAKRARMAVDYNQLNSFSSVVLYDIAHTSTRKTYKNKFNVERIIHRRKIRNDFEYLIKWEGWALDQCTWEPTEHLTPELLRSYEKPLKPNPGRLEEAGRQFYSGVLSALRAKSVAPFYVMFDLDLWRYVSNDRGCDSQHKGYKLYCIEDLALLNLPEHWWNYLNNHGQGQAVKPPLKIKPILSWTPATQVFKDGKLIVRQRMPLEKLCVDILRRPCDTANLFQ